MGDLGLAFARVSRAVRLTIALQSRLMKDLAGQGRAQAHARRTFVHRMVERAIEVEHADEDEIERLSEEAWERLSEDEDWDAVLARPVAETALRICAALGVSVEAVTAVFEPAVEKPWSRPPPAPSRDAPRCVGPP